MKTYIAIFAAFFFLMSPFSLSRAELPGAQKPSVVFNLIKNKEDGSQFEANFVLSNFPRGEGKIAFNFVRPIIQISNAELELPPQGGDFYIIKFKINNPHENLVIPLTGKYFVKKYTDAPSGVFYIKNNHEVSSKVTYKVNLPLPAAQDSVKLKPIPTETVSKNLGLVPLPVTVTKLHEAPFVINPKTEIQILPASEEAKNEAMFFAQSIAPALGFVIPVREVLAKSKNSIILTVDSGITNDEGYGLEVTEGNIIVRAKTAAGFFYGLQTLRQLLPAKIYSRHAESAMWSVPSVIIVDYPRFEYRGLHLDSARHFIPKDQVLRLIDLMAMHKLNYFQWHLTDDEGWRIEIKKYPELTEKGAWRQFKIHFTSHDLLPSFGSGPSSYGGYYSQKDIKEIVDYAAKRHITIIPEIDMPGHARALIMSLPKLLIDPTDTSQYTSIQGYHDNVLSPCFDRTQTRAVLENIFSEVAQLFPGKYIHVGGDEVPDHVWEKSCKAKMPLPKDFKEEVQNEFMNDVQSILKRHGKVMAGWEEVASPVSTLKAPLRVYLWNQAKLDQAYQKSKEKGYEIIMAPAEFLYFDLAYNAAPEEPGQYWAGYVDTQKAYSVKPIATGQSTAIIKGMQGQLWSELIDSRERLDYLAFPKTSALAEAAWTPEEHRNWDDFALRMKNFHLPRLDVYGVQYRKKEFR